MQIAYLISLTLWQGQAGEVNIFSVALVDASGRPFESNGSAIEATIAAVPYDALDNSTAILGIESNGSGAIGIEWTAVVATDAMAVPIYEINVSISDTGEASHKAVTFLYLAPASRWSRSLQY